MKSGRAKTLRRSIALALGLVVAPLLAEGLYRVLRGAELGPTTNPRYVVHDAELGWSYRPGARARHTSAEFDVEVRIHELGFRGASWALEGDPRRRLLLLGDSFAFGWGVAEGEAIGARVEELLPGWQVLNAGVSGYGTGQERLLLARWLERVQPDAVAVLFCANDLFESGTPASYGKRKPWYALEAGELVLHDAQVRQSWLERSSQLYRALGKLAWERGFARQERAPEREWELARALFRDMRDELAASDGEAPLLMLVSETDELADFARAEPGIEHVDLRPALSVGGEGVRFARDGHWTPDGHARAAHALAAALVELYGADD